MKVFWFGDLVVPSGFGRIGNEVCTRLAQRGHEVSGASTLWDGIMPIQAPEGTPLLHKYPFQVFGLAGRDLWSYAANLISMKNPDVVVCCQDFPYAQTLFFNCRLDWSRRGFTVITPIDGTPIDDEWLNVVDEADATMVISRFGVEAMRQAGKRVGLCHPGVDANYFRPASADEKRALRGKAGLAEDAFVLGMMAMNQGRKAIPHTIQGWWEFAKDKPNAYLYLDMDKVGAGGWNLPKLAKEIGIPDGRILYKEEWLARGLTELRDRFCVLDAHSVLAHREGFGLPLVESMACRIPTLAMDYCSGTEIVGGGKGYLVKTDTHYRYGTWGNARDFDPDLNHFVSLLNEIYEHPLRAQGVADVGYAWARAQSWDNAATAVEETLRAVVEKRGQRGNAIKSNSGSAGGVAGGVAAAQAGHVGVNPADASGSAESVGDHSCLQSTAVRVETLLEHPAEPAAVAPGSDFDRRRVDGIRFDSAGWAAHEGDAESREYAVRPDGERGSERSSGGVAVISQFGH